VAHAGHAAHVVHAARAVHVHAAAPQAGEDPLGRGADPVGPVVQHQHRLAVIPPWLVGVLHHQRPVQAAVALDADVGMVEVGAGVWRRELVDEALAWFDRRLGDLGNPIHRVAERDPMPVDGGGRGQAVVQPRAEHLTDP
jgi:hypothetical protein